MSLERALEVWGDLQLTVNDAEVSVRAEGSRIVVRVPDAAAARTALDGLPSIPAPSKMHLLELLTQSDFTIHVYVGDAQVAELGAGSGLLPKLLGLTGVKVDLWQSLRAIVRGPSSN